jgi:predicted MFS family arabinose efflux permease
MRTAAVMATAVAGLLLNTLPAVTGVLARQLSLEPRVLGAFASANYLGFVAGGLSAVAIMRRASPRTMVRLGLAFLLASYLGSAAFGWGTALVALGVLGGIGNGFTYSASYYVFSLEDQARNSAASLLGQTASSIVVITAIPVVAHTFGWRAMFVGLGFLVIPCFLLARYFPDGYKEEEAQEPTAAPAATRGILWVGLVSVTLFCLGMLGMWTYLERIGAEMGIAEQTIARGLTICTVFGFLSSAIVLALGDRVARTIPLVICAILNIVGTVAVGSSNAWVYTIALSVFYFSLPIFLSAQFAAIMHRAPSKRFAVQYQVATNMGSLGPAIGGLVAEQYGFTAVRWCAITLTVVSATLLWFGFFRTSSRAQGTYVRTRSSVGAEGHDPARVDGIRP